MARSSSTNITNGFRAIGPIPSRKLKLVDDEVFEYPTSEGVETRFTRILFPSSGRAIRRTVDVEAVGLTGITSRPPNASCVSKKGGCRLIRDAFGHHCDGVPSGSTVTPGVLVKLPVP
jgi:hypothetical protein